MATPNIVKGQIAIDPTNDLLYYVNESNTLVSTSLSWAKNNTAIQTTENVVIDGDLTVSGTTVTVNAETLLIEDNIIVLNTGATGSPSLNAGIEVERGTSTNVQIRWNESTDKWQFSNDGTTFYNIIGEGLDLSANVTGNLTGNADTASKLSSAKKIELTGPVTGYALFDGSANVQISTSLMSETTSINSLSDVTLSSPSSGEFLKYNGNAWVNDAIDLGTDTTGNYVANLNAGTGINLLNASGEAVSPTISVNTSVIQTRVTNVSDTEIGYLDGVTSAIQNQLDSKAPTSSPTFTGTVSGITKSMVGLTNVDNTSDLNKPISTATQTALNLKANIASPTFTGNVNISTLFVDSIEIDPTGATDGKVLKFNSSLGKFVPAEDSVATAGSLNISDLADVTIGSLVNGQVLKYNGSAWVNQTDNVGTTINNLDDIGDVNVSSKSTNDLLKWDGSAWVAVTPTKSMVGLSNADNTTDLNKPISNATQTALDLKANANTSPTITLSGDLSGNVTLSNLANATLTATIVADSVALGTDTTGNYVSSLVAGTGITLTNGTASEGGTPTISVTSNTYQPLDADLTAIAALSGTSGILKKTATDTWALDTATFVTTSDTGSVTSTMILNGTIVNADINSSAAIAYSKLTLTNSVVNADINSSAAIDLSKLASGTSAQIVLANSSGVPTYATVSGDITITNTGNAQIASNTIVNADISTTAAIAYSKLSLSNSVVNADINSAAAIDYSKLNLSNNITTTDLQSGAARAGFNSILRTVTSSNTLVSTDLAKLIVANSSSDMTITISTSATFNDGDRIDLLRAGTGEVTIAGSGITVNGTPGYRLRAQWSSATLIRLNSTTWVAVGDLKV
jgi:hypothetical protein